jgi:type VI secretion system protein VasG
MATVDTKSLVGKLNGVCREALEGAVGLTFSRTHYNVEMEHWLLKLLDPPNTDVQAILRQYEVDTGRLQADLNRLLDRLKTGNSRTPTLSPHLVTWVQEAWLLASLDYAAQAIRSGHLLCALLTDSSLSGMAHNASSQFARIEPGALHQALPKLIAETAEADHAAVSDQAEAAGPGVTKPSARGALDQYTIDLTARARSGDIDPVLGRDREIRQIADILTRRRQNNPILTGEAGVGKTAVAEGFAIRVVAGDVPPALEGIDIRVLDLGLLQAGAGVRGEFENRLRSVIDDVKASPKPIVLFIDEAHTLIGAGGQAGQGDAANLLKPALARGELRTIAATTWAEYKKYFEKDAALARRFQVVKVEEPAEGPAIEMMRGLVSTLEEHHKVRVLDEAVVESVRLSHRYIHGRQLPDKSVSLLDTACARVAMSQSATPPDVEDKRRRIEQLDVEIGILEREAATGAEHQERIAARKDEKAATEAELAQLEERWKKEKALVGEFREVRGEIEQAYATAEGDEGDEVGEDGETKSSKLESSKERLTEITGQLHELQGERPLLHAVVDGQAVAAVVANWTGVPVGRMVADEIQAILRLKETMEERIIGQSHALEEIAKAIRTSRAKLTDERKPIGVFLMVGTSGVGKTETAMVLADLLYGGSDAVTILNMSEFKEEHKVSTLMGAPPGYVGYGEGGVLTEAVRRRPYSVVLLDEMEKAHPGVQDVFYQVFDKGMLRDSEGRDIDFKNTVIIMTSNAASDHVMSLCADPETMPDAAGLAEALRPELLKVFKPAFLGRVTLLPYFPLDDGVLRKIVSLNLEKIRRRVEGNYEAKLSYAPEVIDAITARCRETESGARVIEHILSGTMLPEFASHFLAAMADGRKITKVDVSMDETGNFNYNLD